MTTSSTAVDTTPRTDTALGRSGPAVVYARPRRRYRGTRGAHGVVA
ncbi:hypothetical protein [Halarchaeum rubridurum]|nr:hypothetical protein [Halarchaeum rubridurum]